MSKQVSVEVCGLVCTGASKTEAKAEAHSRIQSIIEDLNPSVLLHGGVVAVISRVACGVGGTWGYELVRPTDNPVKHLIPMPSYHTREDCLSAAAFLLAQNEGNFIGLERFLSYEQQKELADYFEKQKRYAQAKENGFSDTEALDRAFS